METEDSEETEEWLTTGEVASLLHVSDTTIRTWVKKGYLKCHVTLGGHRRFNKDDINQLKNNSIPTIEDSSNYPKCNQNRVHYVGSACCEKSSNKFNECPYRAMKQMDRCKTFDDCFYFCTYPEILN